MTQLAPGDSVTVIKNDHTGQEVWRYEGRVLKHSPECIVLEARFNREDTDLGYVTFREGDRFVETFYTTRWYNVFEVHDRDDDRVKGWYCNFTRPAEVDGGVVRADDLALDLFVSADGRTYVLDRDEFESLALPDAERYAVKEAMLDLVRRAENAAAPFIRSR